MSVQVLQRRGRRQAAASLSGRFHAARARREDEGGFTIVETVVTMAIVTAILGIVLGVVTNLFQQSQNVRDTVTGVQQDQTAGQALTQYLHSTIVVLPGSDATTLNASILAGINSSDVPGTATLSAVLTNSSSSKLDATFQTTLTPDGGNSSTVNTYDAVNSVTVGSVSTAVNSTSVSVPSGGFPGVGSGMVVSGTGIAPQTTVAGISGSTLTLSTAATATGTVTLTFGSAGFTYYYNNYTTTPVSLSSTTTPGSGGVEYSEIVAIGIDITFLAGPHTPTEGFQADRPSNFQTTVYLQNSSGAPAPTTSVAVASSGTVASGQPLTVVATVTANGVQADGGNVTFTVTSPGGSVLSVCTSPVDVNVTTGQADCTFTPAGGGNYIVAAAFSGTSDLQPSTGSNTIPVPITTTIAITNVTPSSKTLTVQATVTPSAAPGQVNFTLKQSSSCGVGGCTTYNGSGTLSGGVATFTQSGLNSGKTYNITASYAGSGSYQGSGPANSTGTPS
jgi:hypothetical protein